MIELLTVLGCIAVGVGVLAVLESERVRFGRAIAGTCSECRRLRRVVPWHNRKTLCIPCIRDFERSSP